MDSVKDILHGDKQAITRAISAVENDLDEAGRLLDQLSSHVGKAIRIGVTGPPGVGKSTLVDRITAILRSRQKRVAIIAVDPTSPFTGGALLGDRIRMTSAAEDADLFIRSMATRGRSGGLSRAAVDAADILDASGRDYILIETAGVGQTDVDVSTATDCVLVVFSPESGDGVQAMKSGLMEIADLIVINKADRSGADKLEFEIRSAYQIGPKERMHTPILLTEAAPNKGVDRLVDGINEFIESRKKSGAFQARRVANARERIRSLVELKVQKHLWNGSGAAKILEKLAESVEQHQVSPYQAAEKIVKGSRR